MNIERGRYKREYPYTDLAIERRRADTRLPGVEYKREIATGGVWERLKITSTEGAESIGRQMGVYDTLQLMRMDLLDRESLDDATDEIATELCYLTEVMDVMPQRVLVVGIGNPDLTPDAVGSLSAKGVKATMHIREFDEPFFKRLECSEIAVIRPDVLSSSGFDASIAVKAICNQIAPSLVIVIDALAARNAERLGSSIQLSSTGLTPGSGLGNGRHAIDRTKLGVPVLSIGVPTVIDAGMFWMDAKEESGDDKTLRKHSGMFVAPKEVNEIVEAAARIISGAINQAFGLYYQ